MKPQLPNRRRYERHRTPSHRQDLTDQFSYRYVAGWGEDGSLGAVREAAETIDSIARRIEEAIFGTAAASDDEPGA